MKDGIIKGTGNSRYLKSVPNALSLYPTYASFMNALVAGNFPIDLNGLNLGGWNNPGTPLNKATFLKDNTAAIYGLGTDAVPDDVFAWLGKYNQYWWRRYPIEKGAGVEKQIAAISTGDGGTYYISYSTNLKTDSAGRLILGNITELGINSSTSQSALSVLTGKFISPFHAKGVNAYDLSGYCYGNAKKTTSSEGGTIYRASVGRVSLGVYDFVYSASPADYPDHEVKGEYYYELVGKPFDAMADRARCVWFPYKGTGTFGAADPNVFTFPFEPKLVIVTYFHTRNQNVFRPLDGYWANGFIWTKGQDQTSLIAGSTAGGLVFAENGNSLSWYSGNVLTQMNHANTTYSLTALG